MKVRMGGARVHPEKGGTPVTPDGVAVGPVASTPPGVLDACPGPVDTGGSSTEVTITVDPTQRHRRTTATTAPPAAA
ncbi:hypothetical protein KEM60_02262 [Austwickia sp. TVS 96-490-7B]|uniref:hypothetical protein n=1 Tax=Austwickia sp. TVS 96-490-7B TaxID=2830843 RepID=UPI001C57C66C|nr:hypothetical protein [Austwickia sp. TVS 96-490-7B]MBW3086051.1 hypothetical protein [Austwickia sp. TVS 96-490-7B]